MNGKTRKKLYMRIAERDGEFCRNCEKLPSKGQLVIDHIDNNNDNNSFDNYQLLCRACNYKKNPRRPLDQCVSESEKVRKDSISINRSKEPKFREWVYTEIVGSESSIFWDDLVSSGAEYFKMSIESAKRYLRKMVSKVGLLERVPSWDKGFIVRYKNSI